MKTFKKAQSLCVERPPFAVQTSHPFSVRDREGLGAGEELESPGRGGALRRGPRVTDGRPGRRQEERHLLSPETSDSVTRKPGGLCDSRLELSSQAH